MKNDKQEIFQNRLRDEDQEIPYKSQEKNSSSKRSLLHLLLSTDLLPTEKALAFLPYFLFLGLLGVFYISNRLNSEKNGRILYQLNKDIKEQKWDYMSTKAELMFQSKQSEIAAKALKYGIKEAVEPPKKILVQR